MLKKTVPAVLSAKLADRVRTTHMHILTIANYLLVRTHINVSQLNTMQFVFCVTFPAHTDIYVHSLLWMSVTTLHVAKPTLSLCVIVCTP